MEVKRRMARTLKSTLCTEAKKDLPARTRLDFWIHLRVAFPPSSLALLCISIGSLELPMRLAIDLSICRSSPKNKSVREPQILKEMIDRSAREGYLLENPKLRLPLSTLEGEFELDGRRSPRSESEFIL
jgi:hypothetical protein